MNKRRKKKFAKKQLGTLLKVFSVAAKQAGESVMSLGRSLEKIRTQAILKSANAKRNRRITLG